MLRLVVLLRATCFVMIGDVSFRFLVRSSFVIGDGGRGGLDGGITGDVEQSTGLFSISGQVCGEGDHLFLLLLLKRGFELQQLLHNKL